MGRLHVALRDAAAQFVATPQHVHRLGTASRGRRAEPANCPGGIRSRSTAVEQALALDLIQRAQPLPALPDDMPQQQIELVVPLRYELR